MSDISFLYHNEKKRITSSFLIRNLGYQLIPYYPDNREKLPLELSLSISNKLLHMPFRWTFSLQHLETLDLTFDNSAQLDNFTKILENRGVKVDRPTPLNFNQKISIFYRI